MKIDQDNEEMRTLHRTKKKIMVSSNTDEVNDWI